MRRYIGLFSDFRRPLAVFCALSILQFLALAPLPFAVKAVFDTALGDRRMGMLFWLAALIFGLQLVSTMLGLLAASGILGVSTEVVRRLRVAVFDRLYSLSIRYHDRNPTGDTHDRVVHETDRVDVMTRSGFAIALPSIIVCVGILGLLLFINWLLFLVTAAFVPVVLLINRLSRTALRGATRRLHASVEMFSEATFAGLRTMRETRVLGAESQARGRQDVILAEAAESARHVGMVRQYHYDVNRIGLATWVIVVLLVGGVGVIDGRITIGDLFAFYAGLALIRNPLDRILGSVPTIVAGQEALVRVFELLDVDDARPYGGSLQLDITGHLSIEDVSFGYEPDEPVLRSVSLTVCPGEVVALVGPNGTGKTTLANLIVGFYAPDGGRLTIDGVDYHELDIAYLRRQLGVLTQDPVMVPGTVRENITYGRPDISDAELWQAVELADAGPLVADLDAGLDTRAYESGPMLSGGQLQRIALARALLGSPKLLLLDEPSTHLDVQGVAGVLDGLRSYTEPPAMIVITHDPAVAAAADTICRIDGGILIAESR